MKRCVIWPPALSCTDDQQRFNAAGAVLWHDIVASRESPRSHNGPGSRSTYAQKAEGVTGAIRRTLGIVACVTDESDAEGGHPSGVLGLERQAGPDRIAKQAVPAYAGKHDAVVAPDAFGEGRVELLVATALDQHDPWRKRGSALEGSINRGQ